MIAAISVVAGLRRNFSAELFLPSNSLVEELCHQFQSFFGFGQLEVIPEGVRQGFENDEVGIDARLQQRAVERGCIAQQNVACAGDQQAGRHAVQVGEKRRQYSIFPIRFATY